MEKPTDAVIAAGQTNRRRHSRSTPPYTLREKTLLATRLKLEHSGFQFKRPAVLIRSTVDAFGKEHG